MKGGTGKLSIGQVEGHKAKGKREKRHSSTVGLSITGYQSTSLRQFPKSSGCSRSNANYRTPIYWQASQPQNYHENHLGWRQFKPAGQRHHYNPTGQSYNNPADEDHSASLKDLHLLFQILDHVILDQGRQLSLKGIAAIQFIPKPWTKKELLSFLGSTSYCRSYYSALEEPLRVLEYNINLDFCFTNISYHYILC